MMDSTHSHASEVPQMLLGTCQGVEVGRERGGEAEGSYLFSRELGGELVGVGNPRGVPHSAA